MALQANPTDPWGPFEDVDYHSPNSQCWRCLAAAAPAPAAPAPAPDVAAPAPVALAPHPPAPTRAADATVPPSREADEEEVEPAQHPLHHVPGGNVHVKLADKSITGNLAVRAYQPGKDFFDVTRLAKGRGLFSGWP